MAAHINRAILRSHGKGKSILALCQPAATTSCSPGPTLSVGERGQEPVRGFPTSKHYLFKWREERKRKVIKVDLPKFVELKKDKTKDPETPDEIRKNLKKQGRLPPRTFQELPINISCTRAVFDEYKPPEGDGLISKLSPSGIKDKVTKGTKHIKSMRTLKKYEDFDETEFAMETQNMVMEAQDLLQDIYGNQDRLHELVTERAFPEMVHGLETKTMRWQHVETVEPPRVSQVRVEEVLSDKNLFSQITVRLHTKQILAIYDRFGRLMFGDPQLAKSVVEYVVMEKWISDTYGKWRIHAKIIPEWMTSRSSLLNTYRVPHFDPLPPLEEDGERDNKEEGSESEGSSKKELDSGDGSKPKLALA